MSAGGPSAGGALGSSPAVSNNVFDDSARRSKYVLDAVHSTASSLGFPLMARLPQSSRIVRGGDCGWVQARGVGLVTGRLRSSAPATVGEELLQHLVVHLEEFDGGVGERVGKLKRGYFWL